MEPRNADSHLAFIAGGLRPCVTHPNRPGESVFFVDLDGVVEGRPRRRLTRLIGFNNERIVRTTRIEVPVSAHPIDSINLKDPRLGLYASLSEFVAAAGVGKGRLRIVLDPTERHSALTINEYETLLMTYDLAEVLRNPLRFSPRKAGTRWQTRARCPPKPSATRNTTSSASSTRALIPWACVDRSWRKCLRGRLPCPAARFFRMRRSVSLLVSDRGDGTHGLIEGTYQVRFSCSGSARRPDARLEVTLTELK